MFCLPNVIKVQWVTILSISGLYSHTQNTQNNVNVPTATKKETCCTRVFTADTFNLQQVSDGVHKCSKLGLTDPRVVDAAVKINDAYYRDMLMTQKLYCLQCIRSVPYSLPSDNAMLLLLLTECERQPVSWNDRYQSAFISPHLWHPTAQI